MGKTCARKGSARVFVKSITRNIQSVVIAISTSEMHTLSDRYQCLSCLKLLKDHELVCNASCGHIIHEWCVEVSNSLAHLKVRCRICEKDVIVHLIFRELDLVRMMQIDSIPMIVKSLKEISNNMWVYDWENCFGSRLNYITVTCRQSKSHEMNDLENKLQQVADKLDLLGIAQSSSSSMEKTEPSKSDMEKEEMMWKQDVLLC